MLHRSWHSLSRLIRWEQGASRVPMGSETGLSSLSQCDTGDVLPVTTTEVFQLFPSWASAHPGWFWGFTASKTLHSVACCAAGAYLDIVGGRSCYSCSREVKPAPNPASPECAGDGTALQLPAVKIDPWLSAPCEGHAPLLFSPAFVTARLLSLPRALARWVWGCARLASAASCLELPLLLFRFCSLKERQEEE